MKTIEAILTILAPWIAFIVFVLMMYAVIKLFLVNPYGLITWIESLPF